MKTKNLLLTGILGIALAGVLLTGCKKDSTATTSSTDSDITSAQDDGNANTVSNDAKSVSDAAMQTNGLHAMHGSFNFSAYYNATITWAIDTTHGTGDTLYIKFPSTPTQCGDGKYREGEIIVYWPYEPGRYLWQAYLDSNVTITEQFNGYAVGDASNNVNTVSGKRTWTNEGQNQGGYENWNFTANLTLTYANGGGTATWNSIRNNVLTEVNGTWYYSITGSVEGVNRKGADYTINITSPLYITNSLSVNFGTIGACDAKAVATINGVDYPFYMW